MGREGPAKLHHNTGEWRPGRKQFPLHCIFAFDCIESLEYPYYNVCLY